MYKYIFIALILLPFSAKCQKDSAGVSYIYDPTKNMKLPVCHFNMAEFLNNNIRYPKFGLKNKIEGKVYVQFIVDKSGKVIDPIIVQGLSDEFDEEVLRVMKIMPDWEPGYLDDKPVKIKKVLPINFVLPSK